MDRLNQRITSLDCIEEIYSTIAEVDAVKTSWCITNKASPQMLARLTESVVITSTGASNYHRNAVRQRLSLSEQGEGLRLQGLSESAGEKR
jgi:hypothetical protein